ncbi:hypothetical protein MUY22_05970 [Amycolatopsis sp. WQ 127309]|nr:hypothetical protein [Amycolatopsis sp. WQ 127309]UOZ07835.1 hypothetical protein MUY22_05970 [Amycolatopsis sp. WQ 127309]
MDSLLRPLLDAPAVVVYPVCGLLITAETALLPGIVLPTLSAVLWAGAELLVGQLTASAV